MATNVRLTKEVMGLPWQELSIVLGVYSVYILESQQVTPGHKI